MWSILENKVKAYITTFKFFKHLHFIYIGTWKFSLIILFSLFFSLEFLLLISIIYFLISLLTSTKILSRFLSTKLSFAPKLSNSLLKNSNLKFSSHKIKLTACKETIEVDMYCILKLLKECIIDVKNSIL